MASKAKKKGLGGFMRGKASAKRAVSEAELLAKDGAVTPDDVLALDKACKGFLCKTTDNVYGIEFTAFKLRDTDSGTVLFEVAKPEDEPYVPPTADDTDDGRFVRYELNPQFLRLRNVGASITFQVGDQKPISSFRMVERHFFKDRVLKTFDFDFGFCIPGSTNNCEHIYELPKLTEADMADMVKESYETRSDSFYFVDGKLMMHNRADYNYDH